MTTIPFFLIHIALSTYLDGHTDYTKAAVLSIIVGMSLAATEGVYKKVIKNITNAMHGSNENDDKNVH